jgi:ethanolaminephosphotransferase
MKKIVEATYPNYPWGNSGEENLDCEGDLTVGQHLACRWQSIVEAAFDVTSADPSHVTKAYYDVSTCSTV